MPPWPKKQAIAIMLSANRKGDKRLAEKAKDSLRKKPKPKTRRSTYFP